MALVNLKGVLDDAVKGNYAVGAFNIPNHMYAEAVIRAAELSHAPIIAMLPDFTDAFVDVQPFVKYAIERIERADVPIALQWDHGSCFENVIRAMHYGCSAVMIDGSPLSEEENYALTKRVCEIAHTCGVSVEGEIGRVKGFEARNLNEGGDVADETMYTKPEDAKRFVEETGVDAVAIAIGTVHGVYRGTPKLDFDRIDAIRRTVDVPLVLHGGSGLSEADYRECVKRGINKVNFFTGLSLPASKLAAELVASKNGMIQFPDVICEVTHRVTELAMHQIELFGTQKI